MHIDHSKLLELLTEASGLDQETVEKHLLELVSEINEALEEGEAYEVHGFGVFSRIGENTLFIPDDDLATEINYKYAGMSPILLDDHEITESAADETDDEDDPFSGLLDDLAEKEEEPEGEYENIDTSDVDDLSDPFALDDEESAEEEEAEEVTDEDDFTQIPNKIGYNTERTDEESRILFSGLLEEEEDELEEEPFGSDEVSDEQVEPDLEPDLVFNKIDDEDEEDYNDPFDLGDDDILPEEDSEELIQDEKAQDDEPEPVFEAETDQPEEVEDQVEEVDEDIEVFETPDEISDEDEAEEDPFEALAGDVEDEELEEEENIFATKKEVSEGSGAKKSAKEVVPVIKNVASGKQRNKKKSGKADTPKKPMKPASKAPAPVFLWVILFIVVIAGGVYGLGYFGVVNIPGITPATSSGQQMAAQQSEQAEPETPPQQTPEDATDDTDQQATEDPVPEQADQPEETTNQPEEPVQETTTANESTTESTVPPQGQAEYGMDGVPAESANDGYTIVVFSLSNQENAAAKKTELESDGYRVLLAEVPSPQYGSLWRVSLGQFESLRDAAIAAEDLDASLSGNYFITKIQ